MDTVSECPFATAKCFSSGLNAIAEGARPTSTSRTEKSFESITLSVPVELDPVFGSLATFDPLEGASVSDDFGLRPPRFDTKIRLFFPEYMTECGAMPVSISRSILCVEASITASVLLLLNATNAFPPSFENAIPAGRGCPLKSMRADFPGVPFSLNCVT